MIKKFIKIENVGRLKKVDWKGLPELQRLVAIYGDNGSGKTTLTAILRAVKGNSDIPLRERATLGAASGPRVHLLTAAGTHQFDGISWDESFPLIDIFDRAFVNSNVYEGRDIGPDQRANLYRLALGDAEVAATRRVERINQDVKTLRERRSTIEGALRGRCEPLGGSVEELQRTQPLTAPATLDETRNRRRALASGTDFSKLPAFVDMLPPVTVNIAELGTLLDRSVEFLATEAVDAVKEHIADHLDELGESWLQRGVEYAAGGDACPYCGQSLEAAPLATLLPKYFDRSYANLKEVIRTKLERVRDWMPWKDRFYEVHRFNEIALTAWGQLADIGSSPNMSAVAALVDSIAATLDGILRDKLEHPLKQSSTDDRLQELAANQSVLTALCADYRQWTTDARRKAVALAADHQQELHRVTQYIRSVDLGMLVGEPAVAKQLTDLADLDQDLGRHETAKQTELSNIKKAEKAHTESFVKCINEHLKEFSANFKLRRLAGKTTNTRVASDFEIEVDGNSVKASAAKEGQPRADTVLSEGDRTTLALAIFFATFAQRADRNKRVVVFDDPFASLDRNRRHATINQMARLTGDAAQVIVLSHDEYFLRDFIESSRTGCQQLQLRHNANAATLAQWNAEDACRAAYFSLLLKLEDFVSGNGSVDKESAWIRLRPVLEEYLRFRFPKAWGPGDGLGKFVKKAQQKHVAIPLSDDDIVKLDRWKDFSNEPHHANPASSPIVPSESEVRSYAKEVLAFVQS